MSKVNTPDRADRSATSVLNPYSDIAEVANLQM